MRSKLIVATFNSGSTLLQRSLAFWAHQLVDPTVTNPHELLNGIDYHNGYLVKQWCDVNAQPFEQIQQLLEQCPHPIIARLAYDHFLLRHDRDRSATFFQFLQEKFDIFFVTRNDIFDYSLCHALRRQTKRPYEKQINCVHNAQQRHELYESVENFTVSTDDVIAQSAKYLNYINWAQKSFPLAKNIDYADLESDIDQVCKNVFGDSLTIEQKFGISLAEYLLVQYRLSKKQSCVNLDSLAKVYQIENTLNQLCEQKVILDPIPIKAATWKDKIEKISNLDSCIDVFNLWAQKNCPLQMIEDHSLQQRVQHAIRLYPQ
jgi:hypothetical protein